MVALPTCTKESQTSSIIIRVDINNREAGTAVEVEDEEGLPGATIKEEEEDTILISFRVVVVAAVADVSKEEEEVVVAGDTTIFVGGVAGADGVVSKTWGEQIDIGHRCRHRALR
mmetsp:Transcript_2078/g.3604  ORF Transcript_2078/g.3604 Transcript_2078/m.3604 type:complete len:115 (+) Transcript_2078:241-585(+)